MHQFSVRKTAPQVSLSRAMCVVAHPETFDQIQQVVVGRPALLHGRPRLVRQRARTPPPLLPFLPAVHHAPHGLLHHVTPHHDLLLHRLVRQRLIHPDADADVEHLHGHLLVQELVREVRPRHHGNPRRDRLHRGVPPTVRHEAAHRRVRQDQHLRRPLPHEETPPGHARLQLAQEIPHRLVLLGVFPDHPDERVPGRLQPEPELDHLLRVRLGDAPETDVDHRVGLLAVEPAEALVGVDGRGVPSRRQRRHALVVQRHRPYGPHLHVPRRRVPGNVLGLHLHERVHNDAVGLSPCALDVVAELLPARNRDPAEEPRRLGPRHLDLLLQPRHDDGLVDIGDAVVRVEPLDVVLAEEREGAHAEEAEPWDAEVRGELGGPRVAEVRHDAGRERRVRAEVGFDGRAEERRGGEVVPHVHGGDHIVAVRAFREPGRGVVDRELDEPDGQAGALGGLDGRPYPHGRGGCPDDGAERAVGGEEQRGVDGRDQVALQHQRDEHEVRR
ncbi:hypothetical protein QOZ80_6BG0465170 [Eleusine coracana subsp. coracana]|nr:hypothetical protein QOZ80_6BG0465170 [Eleusine coracana subsp. coracana]